MEKIANQKGAQASIFLILGVLILIGGSIFFFIEDAKQQGELPATTEEAATVPSQFAPIQGFVEECLRQTGEEALILIGESGGYVSITDPAYRVDSFAISRNPTESDALSFSKADLGSGAVAYWWYLKSPNGCKGTCELSSKRPALTGGRTSIEGQLESYVENNIEGCLSDFSSFQEGGFAVKTFRDPQVNAKIGEEDVSLALSYPLEMSIDGQTHTTERFGATLDAPLKQMYDLATQITNLEAQYRFLERHTLNLLVAFSGISKERLPPMSDVRFDFGSTMRWSKRDVENKITGFLGGYTQLFQSEGTANFDRNLFSDELAQRLYDSTLIPNPSGKDFDGIEAQFTYLDLWPIYFDLNCNGDVCKPASANSLLTVIGLQTYRFAYDLSYPVLVELTDTEALNGRGYTFRFALEPNIRNNEPMPVDFVPLEMAQFEEASLLCDERQRTSGTITLDAKDSSGFPLSDAQVLYTIMDTSCYIGTTDENGRLSSKFPGGVVGGAITIVHPEAIGSSFDFTPTPSDESLSLTVPSAATTTITVMKKPIRKVQDKWIFVDIPLPLTEAEQALVTLRRVPGEGEQEFFSVAQIDSSTPAAEVQLAPGTYEVDVSILLKQAVKIPAKTQCSKPSLFAAEVCYTIPEVDFAQGNPEPRYVEGGFKANITIPAQKLSSANTVVFYAIAPDIPSAIEDLSVTQDIAGLSQTYLSALQPTYQQTALT